MPPSISVSLSVSPSVSLGHFHSVCSSTPSPFVHTTQRSHPIRLDKEGLARRSFGNGLGLHQWLNWDASEDARLALGRRGPRWRGCSFDQNGDCFLFVSDVLINVNPTWQRGQFAVLFSTHFVPCCAALSNEYLCSKQLWQLNFFPNSNVRRVFYAHRCTHIRTALTSVGIWKSSGQCQVMWNVCRILWTVKLSLHVAVSTYPAAVPVDRTSLLPGQFFFSGAPSSDVTGSWPH